MLSVFISAVDIGPLMRGGSRTGNSVNRGGRDFFNHPNSAFLSLPSGASFILAPCGGAIYDNYILVLF